MTEYLRSVIIIPTHSSYIDIYENFIELLRQNWENCPYTIILALTGEDIDIEDKRVTKIFCGENITLPNCIFKVAEKVKADYYICLLGDAFISKKIQNANIVNLLESINYNNIDYCKLIPKDGKNAEIIDLYIRRAYLEERYSVSFIAFVASHNFVYQEFKEKITDLEFEKKYTDKSIFKNFAIINKDYFNIVSGIDKGKWNRKALRKLKKLNPNIKFSTREKLSLKNQFIYDLRDLFEPLLSENSRKIVKIFLKKMGIFEFTTNE